MSRTAFTTAATPGPWRAVELGRDEHGDPTFIRIEGPQGQKVCDLFAHHSVAGEGLPAVRANAALILGAAPTTREGETP